MSGNKRKASEPLANQQAIKMGNFKRNEYVPPTLLDMDQHIRSNIAEFLNPVEWWYNLRVAAKDMVDWPKPKPELDYDFVYFSISNGYDIAYQGVAHTLNDAYQALLARRTHRQSISAFSFEDGGYFHFRFIKFDRDHPVVPLMTFEAFLYYELGRGCSVSHLDETGKSHFGVASPLPMQPFDDDKAFEFRDESHTTLCHYPVGCFLKWCNGLEPRERISLGHIGVSETAQGCRENFCLCPTDGHWCMYFSPRWFGKKNRSVTNKIFADTIDLWDK